MNCNRFLYFVLLVIFYSSTYAQDTDRNWFVGNQRIEFTGDTFVVGTNSIFEPNPVFNRWHEFYTVYTKEGKIKFISDGKNIYNESFNKIENEPTNRLDTTIFESNQSAIVYFKQQNQFLFLHKPIHGSKLLFVSVVNEAGGYKKNKRDVIIENNATSIFEIVPDGCGNIWVVYVKDAMLTAMLLNYDGRKLKYSEFELPIKASNVFVGNSKVIVSNTKGEIIFLNFNTMSGKFLLTKTINLRKELVGPLIVSPNDSLLYLSISTSGDPKDFDLYQLPIFLDNSNEIISQMVKISNFEKNRHSIFNFRYAPNNKILVFNSDFYLHRIDSPNKLGRDCNFSEDYLPISGFRNNSYKVFLQGKTVVIDTTYDFSIPDTTLCLDNPILTKPFDATFLWENGDTNTYQVPYSGIHRVTISKEGCSMADSLEISLMPAPELDLGADTSLCNADSLLIVLEDSLEYRWQDGSTDHQFVARQSGMYSVRASNANCTVSDTFSVQFSKVNLIPVMDTAACKPLSIVVGGQFDTLYLNEHQQKANVIQLKEFGSYTLRAVTETCKREHTFSFEMEAKCPEEVSFPNALYRNGQQEMNQRFQLFFRETPTWYNCQIYDRWGNQLEEIDKENPVWDGIYRGQHVPSGEYVFHLRYQLTGDRIKQITGSIQVF